VGLSEVVSRQDHVPKSALGSCPDDFRLIAVCADAHKTCFPGFFELFEGPYVGLMEYGFGTADREEIKDVDKLEFEALETAFDGLQDQIGIGIQSQIQGPVAPSEIIGNIGTCGDDKGIPGTVPEHVPQESLVVPFGVSAGGVDVDDPFVQSRSDEPDSIGRPHADNGKAEARPPQSTKHDLSIF